MVLFHGWVRSSTLHLLKIAFINKKSRKVRTLRDLFYISFAPECGRLSAPRLCSCCGRAARSRAASRGRQRTSSATTGNRIRRRRKRQRNWGFLFFPRKNLSLGSEVPNLLTLRKCKSALIHCCDLLLHRAAAVFRTVRKRATKGGYSLSKESIPL